METAPVVAPHLLPESALTLLFILRDHAYSGFVSTEAHCDLHDTNLLAQVWWRYSILHREVLPLENILISEDVSLKSLAEDTLGQRWTYSCGVNTVSR